MRSMRPPFRSSPRSLLALAFGVLAMAGCSNAPEKEFSPLGSAGTAKNLVSNLFGGQKTGDPDAMAAELPARIAAALRSTAGPVAIALFDRTGMMTSIAPSGRNGAYETWTSPENRGVSFLGGVVVSTRGLGDDLMAAETEELSALISARSAGSGERVYYHLNGLGQTQKFSVTCSLAAGGSDRVTMGEIDQPATIMVEDCTNGPFAKQNLYWVARDGTVLKSYQWIGATFGHMTVVHLRK